MNFGSKYLMLDFSSPLKRYANNSIHWFGSDYEERYENNLKDNKDKLARYGWLDRAITYKFNSHGFRCEEFIHGPTLMVLGCSHTMGVGLPVEDTWARLVANNLNLHLANLGIGAHSNDTAFRMCYGWVDIIKPTIVILLSPAKERLEIVTANGTIPLGIGVNVEHHDTLYKNWMVNETNFELNYIKNVLSIKSLCADRSIKFVNIPSSKLYQDLENKDLARDLMHAGPIANSRLADDILHLL